MWEWRQILPFKINAATLKATVSTRKVSKFDFAINECFENDKLLTDESRVGIINATGCVKKCPAFERLLLPEHISNDILQYLIK